MKDVTLVTSQQAIAPSSTTEAKTGPKPISIYTSASVVSHLAEVYHQQQAAQAKAASSASVSSNTTSSQQTTIENDILFYTDLWKLYASQKGYQSEDFAKLYKEIEGLKGKVSAEVEEELKTFLDNVKGKPENFPTFWDKESPEEWAATWIGNNKQTIAGLLPNESSSFTKDQYQLVFSLFNLNIELGSDEDLPPSANPLSKLLNGYEGSYAEFIVNYFATTHGSSLKESVEDYFANLPHGSGPLGENTDYQAFYKDIKTIIDKQQWNWDPSQHQYANGEVSNSMHNFFS